MCNCFINLNSCENWVTQIWRSSSLVGIALINMIKMSATCLCYVIKIKEVISNPIFLSFTDMFSFQFSITSVQIDSTSYLHVSPFIIMLIQKGWLKNWNQKCVIFQHFEQLWELGNSNLKRILLQLDCSYQYDSNEVQHAYVKIKMKEVMSNPIFLSFTECSHSNFLLLLFRYIHLISTCLSMHNMPIWKGWLKNLNQKCVIFSLFWVIVRTGYLKFEKILLQQDCSYQYDRNDCDMNMWRSKLKKLWSIQYFWILLNVLITIFYYFCSDTLTSHVYVCPCIICPYRKDD